MTSKSPCCMAVEKGKIYSWCTCGLSTAQPFCDGSHKGKTELKSLKWEALESGEVWFCSCKKTRTPPFCDGSHSQED